MGIYDYRHVIANERTCFWLLHRLHWPDGVWCPSCGLYDPWAMREKGVVRYRCKGCLRHFSLRTGTVLENSKLPLTKWVMAVGLFKVGISARSLARELAISIRIAWRMLHNLRDSLKNDALTRKLRGQIEVDDTYIGGRRKGKRGRGAAHKSIVVGLKVRSGHIRSLVVPSMETAEIHRVLREHVAKGSRLFTDKYWSYRRVRRIGYRHRIIQHANAFVRGHTHTQSIEGYWGHMKPTLMARHRSVSPKYLQRYLAESDFKHRLPNGFDFIAFVLKRLMVQPRVLPTQ